MMSRVFPRSKFQGRFKTLLRPIPASSMNFGYRFLNLPTAPAPGHWLSVAVIVVAASSLLLRIVTRRECFALATEAGEGLATGSSMPLAAI